MIHILFFCFIGNFCLLYLNLQYYFSAFIRNSIVNYLQYFSFIFFSKWQLWIWHYGDLSKKLQLQTEIVWDEFVLVLVNYFKVLFCICHICRIKCSCSVKSVCVLCKVPNLCFSIVGIMSRVDHNINKDMTDPELIDVEAMDFSDDQTW